MCQKEDWKVHRPTCTSLKGAKWHTVPLVSQEAFMKIVGHPPGTVQLLYNRYDNVQHREDPDTTDPTAPPPNTHGSTPFIVKVQLNSSDVHTFADTPGKKVSKSGVSILIYDRRRTLEATLLKFAFPAAFEPIAELVRTKGPRGLKTFCWATRSGDWSLDLCIDQLPEWQQW